MAKGEALLLEKKTAFRWDSNPPIESVHHLNELKFNRYFDSENVSLSGKIVSCVIVSGIGAVVKVVDFHPCG